MVLWSWSLLTVESAVVEEMKWGVAGGGGGIGALDGDICTAQDTEYKAHRAG